MNNDDSYPYEEGPTQMIERKKKERQDQPFDLIFFLAVFAILISVVLMSMR